VTKIYDRLLIIYSCHPESFFDERSQLLNEEGR
jgi:hypothetical protein